MWRAAGLFPFLRVWIFLSRNDIYFVFLGTMSQFNTLCRHQNGSMQIDQFFFEVNVTTHSYTLVTRSNLCMAIRPSAIQSSPHRQNLLTDGLDKHFKLRQVETGVFRLTKQTTLVCNSCANDPIDTLINRFQSDV